MSACGPANTSSKTNYDEQSMEIDDSMADSVLKCDETLAMFKNTFVQNDLSTLGPNETLTSAILTSDDDSRSTQMYETFNVTRTANQTTDTTQTIEGGGKGGMGGRSTNATINMTYDRIGANSTQDLSKCQLANENDAANSTRRLNTTVTLSGAALPSMSMHSLNEPSMLNDETVDVSLVDNETFDFKSKQLNRTAEANKKVQFCFSSFSSIMKCLIFFMKSLFKLVIN